MNVSYIFRIFIALYLADLWCNALYIRHSCAQVQENWSSMDEKTSRQKEGLPNDKVKAWQYFKYRVHLKWHRFFQVGLLLHGYNIFCCWPHPQQFIAQLLCSRYDSANWECAARSLCQVNWVNRSTSYDPTSKNWTVPVECQDIQDFKSHNNIKQLEI